MKRVAGIGVGTAVILALLLDARSRAGCADCLPSYDMADYLARALRLVGAARESGPGAAWRELIRADLHPPGHPALLALWLGAGAAGIGGACWLTTIELGIALLALVLLGHRLDRERGVWAGLLAAGMTALSGEHQRLAAVTMTEAPALALSALALLALVGHARAGGSARALGAGVAIALAALVRYNLAPMLLLPAWIAWISERIRAKDGWRRPDPLLLALPTALVFGAWWALEPKLPVALGRFFENVDSGLDPFSLESLLWAPKTLAGVYTLGPGLAAAWGLAALLGIAAAWRRGAWNRPGTPDFAGVRLVQLYALLGLAAVALHPFKLPRALHGVVPFLYLVGALPLARLPLPRGAAPRAFALRALALGGLALGLAAGARGQLRRLDAPEALGRPECLPAREPIEALDELVERAAGRRSVAISGGAGAVSPHAVELWLRLDDPARSVAVDPPAPPDCASRPAPGCVGPASAALLTAPEMAAGEALVVSVERRAPDPGAERARALARLAGEAGVPRLHTLKIHGGLAELKVYGQPGPPEARR